MTLIIDGLLVAAAAFAGAYCFVLARRVSALKDLDSGIGGAITRMTRALEDARRALEEAKNAGAGEHRDLKQLVARAETASAQLRVLLAASRDLPEHGPAPEAIRQHEQTAPAPADADDPWLGESEARPAPRATRRPTVTPAPVRSRPRQADHDVGLDQVPQPARLVRSAAALLRPPAAAAPLAPPADEAGLLAALAEFAGSGRA